MRSSVCVVVLLAALIAALARPPGVGSVEGAVSSQAEAEGVAAGNTLAGRTAPPARGATCSGGDQPGDSVGHLTVAGQIRTYRLHVPQRSAGGRSLPLVLNFHGYGASAADQERTSGFVPISDREGFYLVTPEGSGSPPGWDIKGVYNENGVDDVGFVSSLVTVLSSRLCIDPQRVYATGMSNGAEMAAQVACMLPRTFAAVAPVAGAVYQGCAGGPVPMIAFHGTYDANVDFEWAAGAVAAWARHNGCGSAPDVRITSAGVRRESYLDCGGNDVVFYSIPGGGHVWPGGSDNASRQGSAYHGIYASELAWQFFQAHAKPASATN
jgi:polyhydroxybutyrate depolymerase